MAKVNAPLFGFSATGTIGKSVTFGNWKGVPYARQRVTPANPRSTQQTTTRNCFSNMSAAFKAAPGILRDVFSDSVQGKPLTPRNRFIGVNLAVLRGAADLAGLITSPGTRSAPGIGSVSAATGTAAGEIDLTYGLPELPSGWTLERAHIASVLDGDPDTKASWEWITEIDPAATGTFTASGFTTGESYAVTVFLEFTRPDGQAAYSVSKTDIAIAG